MALLHAQHSYMLSTAFEVHNGADWAKAKRIPDTDLDLLPRATRGMQ